MDNSSEPVWIMFATDIESRDKLLKYASGSQWQVDPNTAASLILVGAAERLASPLGSPSRTRGQRNVDDQPGKRLSLQAHQSHQHRQLGATRF